MTDIVDYSSKYAAANTAFIASFEALFGRPGQVLSDLICEKVPVSGMTLEAPFLGSGSTVREWVGSKRFEDLRAHGKSYPVKPYEKSIRLPALQVRHDTTGAIGRAIAREMGGAVAGYFEKPVFDMLYSNPSGFDGVALISGSHPYGAAGATQSNTTSNALSHSSFRAGIQAMQSWTMGNGEPLEMSPTHLVVGVDNEAIALEIAGIDKPVGVAGDGSLDSGTRVAAVTIRNVYEGRVTVVVSPRVRSGCWYLMDLSKPGLRPLVLGEARAPTPIPLDDEKTYSRFYRDEWVGSVEADFALGAGLWPTIYGKPS
ncbi:Mu-like prophage major head subunit gpT family protein [Sandaracinus amylolyticus]|uniref:Putative major head subunit protein n=1 Tax=Sandaracinus amylolyticus TaxID=927083 RepID=A0A0F6W703_9BACT|nr:Mu-like prophage major head subunit gpT family protein [Sandaracinus amylolyticus]AKF08883.1 putative major head subunit protein [Sandaracinus amylolyticus]